MIDRISTRTAVRRAMRHGQGRRLRIPLLIALVLILSVPGIALRGASNGWAAEQKAQTEAQPESRPNVLFIAIDDLSDWVGCLGGHPNAKTPNIDRLAAAGTLFTNAHCQGPICGPSRASLLSGLYPHTTGVYQQPVSGQPLPEDTEHFRGHLLPEYFAAHGYTTYGCGKITHGYPIELAFEHSQGDVGGSGPKPAERIHYHLPDVPYTGTQTDWGAFPDSDDKMPDHKAANWAIERIADAGDGPFFLAVGFRRPHVPFYVPQKWFDLHPLDELQLPEVRDDDLDDVPETGRRIHEMPKYPNLAYLHANDDEQFYLVVQAYLACVSFVDHEVGRMLDALAASRYADNTVIVLFSDHGYHLGEKDRVSKHGLWEESTRVPLVVVRPGDPGGQRSAKPVGLIDLYPTLVELCGLPPKPSNEGLSLLRLLDDPRAPWRPTVLTTYARGNHSLRSGRYRYIRYDDGTEELYDHRTDPQEWTNLADEANMSNVVKRFRVELPENEAPYHASTSLAPVNAWFEEHFLGQGLGGSSE